MPRPCSPSDLAHTPALSLSNALFPPQLTAPTSITPRSKSTPRRALNPCKSQRQSHSTPAPVFHLPSSFLTGYRAVPFYLRPRLLALPPAPPFTEPGPSPSKSKSTPVLRRPFRSVPHDFSDDSIRTMSSLFNKSGGGSRFQLPALNLNFGSITDGTNIPPPPDSPIQKVPTPPQTPPPVKEVEKETDKDVPSSSVVDHDSKVTPQQSIPASSNGNLAGTKRYADEDVPLSPAASSRQGSIRRLFSRTMLNNSYAEGQISSNGSIAGANNGRPSSQGGASFLDDRKSRRSSGWFRRIRTGDAAAKRASTAFVEEPPRAPTPKKPSGPPPPMIPELTDLEKDDGSLGSDLFKNIK
ncbi:hypothetical protein FALBO_9423 [Fusarium albosuccineum]|uniref:Uncharacterized protein n=1 Tax=Fusarium albosuccineum TaxID=1237068 RepID=A0A8H4L9M5_9HYPO|nr:hypothetical protein FALBO_9423 [Fusarium albosuccineum]